MNRAIIAALMLVLASTAAPAQQTRFYGPEGRSMGTATTSGNTTTFYGADGRRTGSATKRTLAGLPRRSASSFKSRGSKSRLGRSLLMCSRRMHRETTS
jgi:hypothetical protein